MPYFEVSELHITPGEFIDSCSKKELEDLFEILSVDYGYGDSSIEVDESRSQSYREFARYLRSLRDSWYSISIEDSEKIEKIAKKYGAF